MPELPEVEVTRRGLLPLLKHGNIVDIQIRQSKLRWPIPVQQIQHHLKNQPIQAITRRGKYLLFACKTGTFLMHLGMSGHLKYLSAYQPFDKHDHVEFSFQTGARLRYYDPRRFGALLWLGDHPLQHPLLCSLGCEPLTRAFNADYLLTQSRNSKQPIKSFLMQQQVVVGIGNIYASEALFHAHINPLRPANTLDLGECATLVKSSKAILKKAIRQGGTTLRDFAHTDGKPGYFSHSLQVYGRESEPCPVCASPIQRITLGQRSTYFCGKCQH